MEAGLTLVLSKPRPIPLFLRLYNVTALILSIHPFGCTTTGKIVFSRRLEVVKFSRPCVHFVYQSHLCPFLFPITTISRWLSATLRLLPRTASTSTFPVTSSSSPRPSTPCSRCGFGAKSWLTSYKIDNLSNILYRTSVWTSLRLTAPTRSLCRTWMPRSSRRYINLLNIKMDFKFR